MLLTPTIDHLFDKGFISFENKGDLIVSPVADRPSLLASMYEVSTKRLNEQVRRNEARFPGDFTFVLIKKLQS